ncbi:hypothetical protein [Streptomyces zagrosensis]|uniref:Uncharacterized protein n=1 Tax=Streptomyces zagrosensis TaxID=1042984 RepID=A0A7W9Q7E1_9ACTN|nr:hypothetical protein [Streptomyces zagrosensis]MBB5933907.1 hypothetical protein [Streptomyces zagrosensis]
MSDFQERPAHRTPSGSDTAHQADHEAHGAHVDQVFLRWDGNQGRQGTGMKAVAHSCHPERAAELGRELGPLLWVSGTTSPRRSVVRTMSRDGHVMLIQRWPTTDPSGRPSTVSHVLIGEPGSLKTRQCIGLAHGGWSKREYAETVTGELPPLECATLAALARERLNGMSAALPMVRKALTLVTAEWLRDPTQRVSLLADGAVLPHWPERDAVPLVYLGLFMLFGSWFRQEWTFATYDTVDTHQLRLMCVPRWEPDTGGTGPLARVMGRPPAHSEFEQGAAARLVEYLLTHPTEVAGLPQLVKELQDGTELSWAQRSARLRKILAPTRAPSARTTPAAPSPTPPAAPHAPTPAAPAPAAWQAAPGAGQQALTHEAPGLHAALRDRKHGNPMQRGLLREHLREQLRTVSDEVLLHEMHLGELPRPSLELLLDELGRAPRVQARQPATQHKLCTVVLSNDLYIEPNGLGGEPVSRTDQVHRAADLFTWAVAPLARDERYLPDLRELLYRMFRDRPTAESWLRVSIIAPHSGVAPDLPPTLWQQILRDMLQPSQVPPAAAHTSFAGSVPASAPELAVDASAPNSLADRFSDLLTSPGCVVAAGAGLISVLIAILVILV